MDTHAGDVVGSPSYLSPEQVRGVAVDARCDLYSLGVIAHELLTGSRPYACTCVEQLLELHLHAPVPVLPQRHAAFQPVLERLMAKEREHRYPSAGALLLDLQERGF
jgi:serine/threonine-protein kinase PpkA